MGRSWEEGASKGDETRRGTRKNSPCRRRTSYVVRPLVLAPILDAKSVRIGRHAMAKASPAYPVAAAAAIPPVSREKVGARLRETTETHVRRIENARRARRLPEGLDERLPWSEEARYRPALRHQAAAIRNRFEGRTPRRDGRRPGQDPLIQPPVLQILNDRRTGSSLFPTKALAQDHSMSSMPVSDFRPTSARHLRGDTRPGSPECARRSHRPHTRTSAHGHPPITRVMQLFEARIIVIDEVHSYERVREPSCERAHRCGVSDILRVRPELHLARHIANPGELAAALAATMWSVATTRACGERVVVIHNPRS